MRHPIGLALWLCLTSLVEAGPALAGDATAPPGHDEELRQAWALLQEKQYKPAITAFERLDQLAGGRCGDCQVYLAEAHARVGERPESAVAARRAIGLVRDPERLAYANAVLAFSLLDKDAKPGDLAEAEAAVRQTLDLDPSLEHWGLETLYWILFHRQHYDDMVAEGRAYLEKEPQGSVVDLAHRLICTGRSFGNIPAPELSPPTGIVKGRVSRPKPLYHPPPTYTDSAFDARIRGAIIVRAIIDTEGCVVETDILQGLDSELDQTVLDTVRRWVFQPATVEGQPVKVFYSLTVNFNAPEPK